MFKNKARRRSHVRKYSPAIVLPVLPIFHLRQELDIYREDMVVEVIDCGVNNSIGMIVAATHDKIIPGIDHMDSKDELLPWG